MWIDATLAGIATLFAIVTLIWPTWIEILFDEPPDAGDGSAERAFALLWIIVAMTCRRLAWRDKRRLVELPAGPVHPTVGEIDHLAPFIAHS
jgi:hypothetical protein